MDGMCKPLELARDSAIRTARTMRIVHNECTGTYVSATCKGFRTLSRARWRVPAGVRSLDRSRRKCADRRNRLSGRCRHVPRSLRRHTRVIRLEHDRHRHPAAARNAGDIHTPCGDRVGSNATGARGRRQSDSEASHAVTTIRALTPWTSIVRRCGRDGDAALRHALSCNGRHRREGA